MTTFKEMIDEKDAEPLNNLFFNFNEYELLPTSLTELKRVSKIITQKQLKVEIVGYADSVGTTDYNIKLAEHRANAVREFLIKEGCNANMLTTVKYDTLNPVNINKTEEARTLNRKVKINK